MEIYDDVRITGGVYVDEINIYNGRFDVTEIRKKIGFIQQTPVPLPMSIYDNVAYGPRTHGIRDKGTLNAIVERCLKSAGLWDEVNGRLKEPATKLSIGQQQRLCIARTLSVEPEVILCDEPTSALDPVSARHIENLLQRLKKEYTVVLVTHTLRLAERLADNVIFIYLGQIVEEGPAEQVFAAPNEEKTKAYVAGEIS
jgi:phosphate transport system ATP-binding protein